MGDLHVRAATAADREGIADVLTSSWGGTTMVVHATVYEALSLPALLAEQDGQIVGLLTYTVSDEGLEIVSLDAVIQRSGVGSSLLTAAAEAAKQVGAQRIWLVTTNDNLDALRFYQRRGLRIVDVIPGAVDAARAVKPSIPLRGEFGIPLHDELTLELLL
ncbi:GNAT family N-acetyltransferase [Streptomyces sp. NPDC127190]|uniref:GNAT family N-acetyltransferase n=1 Tax=unclassified Streptomyces TaxID=2593676 RepID=UPI003637C2F3